MPVRKIPLVTGHFYHIYNRGVARQPTFFAKRDYERFLLSLRYYRMRRPATKLSYVLSLPADTRETVIVDLEDTREKLVEIVCFVLMPNHFHLLVKQLEADGISAFLRHALNSYTKYINTKKRRPGPLFQGEFKAVRVETEEQLLHLSRYIHLNPFVSAVVTKQELRTYPWSSLPAYLGDRSAPSYLSMQSVLEAFSTRSGYEAFVFDHAEYAKKLENLKHLLIEKEERW